MSDLPSSARAVVCLLLLAPLASPACSSTVIQTSTGSGTGGSGASTGAATTGDATTGITSTGAATTGTASTGATSSGTGADCGSLGQAYAMALAMASQCDICKGPDGCLLGVTFTDLCGCPVVADGSEPAAIQKAKDAYDAWAFAGCMPMACGQPCSASKTWHCSTLGNCIGFCAPQ